MTRFSLFLFFLKHFFTRGKDCMAYSGIVTERNQEATVYVGELDQQVNESILWELMLQAGPVGNFCTFKKVHQKKRCVEKPMKNFFLLCFLCL